MRTIAKTAFAMFLLCLLVSTTSYSATVTVDVDHLNAVASVSGLSWTIPAHAGASGWVEAQDFGPYDVYFDAGSFNDVVLPVAGVAIFADYNEAFTASTNLASAINAYNALPTTTTQITLLDNGQAYDAFPSVANIACQPVDSNNASLRQMFYSVPNGNIWMTDSGTYVTSRTYAGNTWAVFHTSSVPIPGAVWLLGSGLIGLVGIRRNIKS